MGAPTILNTFRAGFSRAAFNPGFQFLLATFSGPAFCACVAERAGRHCCEWRHFDDRRFRHHFRGTQQQQRERNKLAQLMFDVL